MIFVGRPKLLSRLTIRIRYGDISASYEANHQMYITMTNAFHIRSNRANLTQFLDKCQARWNKQAMVHH